MKKKARFINIITAFVLAILMLFLIASFEKLYSNVDNFNISLVTNGLFDKDAYTYYLHPWLCKFINILANILPKADAYVLLMHTLLFVCIWSIFDLILNLKISRFSQIVFIFITFTSGIAVNIWNCNYTIHAAFFVFTGAILILNGHSWLYRYIVGIILLCFGFMWRIKGALLISPFIILDICFRIINNRNYKILRNKGQVKYFLIPLLCIAILCVSQYTVENSKTYKKYVEYSVYRTKVEDFPVASWKEISEKMVTVTEADYKAVVSWILLDTDRVNTHTFKQISDVGSINKYPYSVSGVIQAIKEMIHTFISYKSWTFIFSGIILSIIIYLLLNCKSRWKALAEIVFAIFGAFVIILYFSIRGRAVLHIWVSVNLITEYLIVVIAARELQRLENKKKNKLYGVILLSICVIGVFFNLIKGEWHIPQLAINSRTGNEINEFERTYENDNVYIWGSWHKNVTSIYMNNGKLPTQEFMNHNISAGDWTYGQKFFNESLLKMKITNPALALLERDNTYFVDEDCKFVCNYLRQSYGKKVSAVKVGKINNITVWKFKTK